MAKRLKDIDLIDWSQLQHCYGEASNLPGMLRDLLSRDAYERRVALSRLFEVIWHQGTIYEATSFCVPFLYEILQSPRSKDKESVVQLLTALANGSARNPDWVQQTKANIEEDLNLLYPYLNHAKLGVNVVQTLAYFPKRKNETIPLLREAWEQESRSNVKQHIEAAIEKLETAL